MRFLRDSARALSLVLELAKFRITIAVVITTAAGYILHSTELGAAFWETVAGVLVLACGSSALNQAQEWGIDALMHRTRHRPIPSGRIRPRQALIVAGALLAAGLAMLAHVGSMPLLLGVFSVVWYNGVYTFLKRRTSFAVVPGALIGAVPPLIGWVAAGGALADARILSFCLFLFLWQVPHFWLLLLIHGDDYERAGLPSLRQSLPPRTLGLFTYFWILLVACAGFSLSRYGVGVTSAGSLSVLRLASIALVTVSGTLLGVERQRFLLTNFITINAFALVVILAVCADRVARQALY